MRKQLAGWLMGGMMASLSFPVVADTREQLATALAPWDPQEIHLESDALTVITRERRMTDQVLIPLISAGVCAPLFAGAPASYLAGIQKVSVLNTFGRQGYVFSGGRQECQEIGDMPMGDAKGYILSSTRMHTN